MPWITCKCPTDVTNKLNQILQALTALGRNQATLGQNQVQLAYQQQEQLRRLDNVYALVFSQVMPDCFSEFTLVSERMVGMVTVLKYRTKLSPTTPRTKEQNLGVAVGGVPVVIEGIEQSKVLAADVVDFEWEVIKDSTFELSRNWLDHDGNKTSTTTQEALARDTINADEPGPFDELTLIGEREIEDPA